MGPVKLVYTHAVELNLNNITAALEREIIQFDLERAMAISMFMHEMESANHNWSEYQDKLWLELTRKIEERRK